MEKRLFLAFGLSIFILVAYSSLVARLAPPPATQITAQSVQKAAIPATNPSNISSNNEIQVVENKQVKENLLKELPSIPPIEYSNEDLSLLINQIGASIKTGKDKTYHFTLPHSRIGLLSNWQNVEFTETKTGPQEKAFVYTDRDSGLKIKKSFHFTENKYILLLNVDFENTSTKTLSLQYDFNISTINEAETKKDKIGQNYFDITVATPSNITRSNFFSFKPAEKNESINWIGVRDRYFCILVKPDTKNAGIVKSKDGDETSYAIKNENIQLIPGQSVTNSYLIYIGPQKKQYIEKLGSNTDLIVNYGIFDSIAGVLLGSIKFFYGLTKSWGLAIILFSIAVFALLSPLSKQSFSSMKKMQALQPEVEALRTKYKDSPERLNKEIMLLYRERGINPLAGCLPMLLQMPIFIALYQLLIRFVDLKGAHFLWIKDLSEPDRLFMFPSQIPFIGDEFNILPLIMMVTMLIQQRISSASQSQGQMSAQQQKMMSLFMAVIFGIIFYRMPSGLVLYWTINSILMLVFQLKFVK